MKAITSKLTVVCLVASLGSVFGDTKVHHVNFDGAKVEVNTTTAHTFDGEFDGSGSSRIVDVKDSLNTNPFNWMVAYFATRDVSDQSKHLIGFGIRTSKKLFLIPQWVDKIKNNLKANSLNAVQVYHLFDLPIELNIASEKHAKTGFYKDIVESSIGGTSMMLAEGNNDFGTFEDFKPVNLNFEADVREKGNVCFLFGYKNVDAEKRAYSYVRVDHVSCDQSMCKLKVNSMGGRVMSRICGYGADIGSPVICGRGKLTYIVYPDTTSGCSSEFQAVKAAYIYPRLRDITTAKGDPVNF